MKGQLMLNGKNNETKRIQSWLRKQAQKGKGGK